jgi:hypothetical protein
VYRRRHKGALTEIAWVRRVICGLAALGAFALGGTFAGTARADGYRGYVNVDGTLGFVSGIRSPGASIAPGFNVEFGVGPTVLPLTLGLSAGIYTLDQKTIVDQTVVDVFEVYNYTQVQATELRHLEFVMRLEPDWQRVRPFASAAIGVAAVYLSLTDDASQVDEHLDTALYRSVAVGVDIEPWPRRAFFGTDGLGAVILTVGVRGSETGALFLPSTDVPTGSLRVISPFIGLTFAGWS